MRDLSASIVGVIDLLDGQAVRAIGGERHRYEPWRSPLADSSDPLAIAQAFRNRYGITQLYIADLDALLGRRPSPDIIKQLVGDGFQVTLDAGPRGAAEIESALATCAQTVVLPLETLPHRSDLLDWSRQFDPQRLAFGLDLSAGVPMAQSRVWEMAEWDENASQHIAGDVVAMGIKNLIVLDLQPVGRGAGPTTMSLCQELRRCVPSATIWTGGGVRNPADVLNLREAGADRVLIATALHKRSL